MPGSVPDPPKGSEAVSPARALCVLFHPPGAEVPSELLNSLARRIGRIASCTDAYTAMAEVCASERDRASSTQDASPATVLLLVEPRTLRDAAELTAQLRLFAPAAVCWKFQRGANPVLSAVVDSDVGAWSTKDAGSADSGAPPATVSRSGGAGHSPHHPPAKPRVEAAPSQPSAPAASSPRLRLAGASLPDPSGPFPDAPEIIVRPQPKPGRPAHTPPSIRPQPPALTLRGSSVAGDPPERSRPPLSADELRMLLGDDLPSPPTPTPPPPPGTRPPPPGSNGAASRPT
ncbi:MAG: hypothetical protein ACK4WH_02105 [Phycisphaerales bacterium]